MLVHGGLHGGQIARMYAVVGSVRVATMRTYTVRDVAPSGQGRAGGITIGHISKKGFFAVS
jgi:hypothetical protein